MRRINGSWRVVLMGVGVAWAGMSCQKAEDVKTPEVVRPVVTAVAQAPGSVRVRLFSGSVRAAVLTPLGFRVSGTIRELTAERGMTVAADQVIARLDPKDYELQVKQSEAQLAQSQAQVEQAQSNFERSRQLYEARNIGKGELDNQEASYKSAVAARDALQKALEMARQQLGYCQLQAPTAGTISEVPVEIHQTVSAGQTVAVMSSDDNLELVIGVPEALIGQVRVGTAAEINFDTLPGTAFAATISEVGIDITSAGTYPVKLRLTERDPRIRIGMVGEARLDFAPAADGPVVLALIPAEAVFPSPDGKRHVWIYLAAAGKVKDREVQLGAMTSEGLEVISGLAPGDVVVTRGVNRLADGQKVRLLQP